MGFTRSCVEVPGHDAAVAVVCFEALYHIGTFSGQRRGRSYEGTALSVSECPEAWRKIARLGDDPTWSLHRQGNAFLDSHSLNKDTRATMMAWGVREGWIAAAALYQFKYYDDELETDVLLTFETRSAAEAECSDDDLTVEEISGFVSTQKLADRMTYRPCPASVPDFIEFIWAEAHGLDGVFFNERLDPTRLSAPRAGIVESRLSLWSKSKLDQRSALQPPRPSRRP